MIPRLQAIEFLGCSKETLLKLVKDGKIPAENRGQEGKRQYLYFNLRDLKTIKAEGLVGTSRRRRKTNGHATAAELFGLPAIADAITAEAPVRANSRPGGMLSEILAEVKAINARLDRLEKLWS
jgi:hypothetical protein